MKTSILMIALLVCTIACKKEKSVSNLPTVVLDQAKVEQNTVGTWEGTIRSGSLTENIKVTVEKMTIGNKAATGTYSDSSFSCDFEWTYESFAYGMVTFREKTLHPAICLDNLPVAVYFLENDFQTLHIRIAFDSYSYEGALMRK